MLSEASTVSYAGFPHFLAAHPPKPFAHRINEMPVSIPVGLHGPAQRDAGLDSVHWRAVVAENHCALTNHPTRDVHALVRGSASAEGEVSSALPELT